MNLKAWKEVESEALPSLNRVTVQSIPSVLEVKGAAIDASNYDREIPTSACFNAPQSFAPSPHMPTFYPFS